MSDPTAPEIVSDSVDPGNSAARVAAVVKPDGHLRAPRQSFEWRRVPWSRLGVISAGGMLGALARYGLQTAFPHRPGSFGWATFGINVSGCLLLGMLMVAVTEVWRAHALVRPFLGVGVLGGFTTFSTYIVDIQQAVTVGAPRTALTYLAGTVLAALAAVYTGAQTVRLLTRPHRLGGQQEEDGHEARGCRPAVDNLHR